MSEDMFLELPRPLSATVRGPTLRYVEPTLIVDYDFERDDGVIEWTRVVFHDVLAFQYRQAVSCTADDMRAYSHLLRLTSSSWLAEITGLRAERLVLQAVESHSVPYSEWRMYFDDSGCIAAIARSFEVAEPGSIEVSGGMGGLEPPDR